MSEKAILDTIKVELRQQRAEGNTVAFISPGNYGLDFMKESYGMDLDRSVKCSNFIGETIDMVCELGFDGMMLTGHIGKLVKVAGGIMNTHSHEADCRAELMCTAALRAGIDADLCRELLDTNTTEEALDLLRQNAGEDAFRKVMDVLAGRIDYYLRMRARNQDFLIGAIIFSNCHGLLAATEAADLLKERLAVQSKRAGSSYDQ
jgi:cobalt-precorrin-5B (C1)-methyltransferase